MALHRLSIKMPLKWLGSKTAHESWNEFNKSLLKQNARFCGTRGLQSQTSIFSNFTGSETQKQDIKVSQNTACVCCKNSWENYLQHFLSSSQGHISWFLVQWLWRGAEAQHSQPVCKNTNWLLTTQMQIKKGRLRRRHHTCLCLSRTLPKNRYVSGKPWERAHSLTLTTRCCSGCNTRPWEQKRD